MPRPPDSPSARALALSLGALSVACACACGGSSTPTAGDAGAIDARSHADATGKDTGSHADATGKDTGSHPKRGDSGGDARGKTDGSARDSGAGDGGVDTGPPGKLIFNGDFETGDLSQWAYVEQCQPGRITVYSASNLPVSYAPAPRQGKYAAYFHVLDTDVSPCTSTDNPRAQLESCTTCDSSDPGAFFTPGVDAWEAWSLYVPTSFPGIPASPANGWLLFEEDYGSPWDMGAPESAWYLEQLSGKQSLLMSDNATGDVATAWNEALPMGQWIDFLVHKAFSNTADGGGFVEAWANGAPLTSPLCNCTHLSMETMHTDQDAVGFFLSSYRLAGMIPGAVDLFYDGAMVGTTRESVTY